LVKGGMGPGVARAVDRLGALRDVPKTARDWGPGCDVRGFFHPVTATADENYLSVVTFVHCGDIRIVFAGDLTRQGWKDFLGDQEFVRYLGATNIFVASHHGREDGYCSDVFEYCRPSVVIASDQNVQYDSQIVNYGQHASGIWNGTGWRTQRPLGGFHIQASG